MAGTDFSEKGGGWRAMGRAAVRRVNYCYAAIILLQAATIGLLLARDEGPEDSSFDTYIAMSSLSTVEELAREARDRADDAAFAAREARGAADESQRTSAEAADAIRRLSIFGVRCE